MIHQKKIGSPNAQERKIRVLSACSMLDLACEFGSTVSMRKNDKRERP